MNVRTHKIFERIEKQRRQIFDEIIKISPEQYHKSVSGRWSIGQILTHLLTSEQLSLAYMRKKSLGIDKLENTGLIESMKMVVLRISQRLPFKFKAPPIVLKLTPPALSQQELVTQWEASRAALKEFLESLDEKNLNKKVYKHPVGGMLNVNQAIDFYGEHIHHHLPQIKRLLK